MDEGYHSRQGRLALAYKLAVKRLLDCMESRVGKPLDSVLREAVMVEMATFFHTAKDLLGDEDPVYEHFYHQVVALCQSTIRSNQGTGSKS